MTFPRPLFIALAGLLVGLVVKPEAIRQQPRPGGDDEGLSLTTPRHVRFTTDEGTWISLDVSPDGRTIVFDLLGDLYTLPIDGGRATRITSGPAFDGQPRYSPDGRTIVFTSDRNGSDNVWLLDADGGNPRALTTTRDTVFISPEWTPDGLGIVVSKRVNPAGDAALVLLHRDGGSGMDLSHHASAAPGVRGFADVGAAFSRRSPRQMFFSVRTDGFGNLGQQMFQIASLDFDTGKVQRLTNNVGGAMRPAVSPDGAHLVYATREDGRTGWRLRELNTGAERWLLRDAQRDERTTKFTRDLMPGSAFTPDGRSFITTNGGKIWRISVPSGEVRPIPFTADVDLQLGELTRFSYRIEGADFEVRQIQDPKISPDGKRLVFSAIGRVWLMDVAKGAPRPLTGPATLLDGLPREGRIEQSPAWSPDGKSVAYVTWSDLDGGNIYCVNIDGSGEPKRLSRDGGFYRDLAYSPDGSRLVAIRGSTFARRSTLNEFERSDVGDHELVWVPSAGGDVSVVTQVTNSARRPHFAVNHGRVLFYQPGEGVVSVRFDGSERHVLLKVMASSNAGTPAGERAPRDILVAPDGRRAVAVFDDAVFLIALPALSIQPASSVTVGSAASALPTVRITRVGGEFPAWSADGGTLSYALAHSVFTLRVDDWPSRASLEAPGRVDVALRVARDHASGTVVLRGGRILTMRRDADAEIIRRGDIVIENGRITAVGATGTLKTPPGATVFDMSGKTILPGWVDIHSHIRPGDGIHRTQVWEYLAELAYGVTTIRDPQSSTSDVFAYADLLDAGSLLGPRLFSTGPGVFRSVRISSLADAREVLTRYAEYYRSGTLKEYLAGDRRVRQWIIMAAQELRLTPTTEGDFDFRQNLTEAFDGYAGKEHSYPNFPLYRDVVQLVAKSGVTYTPTLIINYGGPPAENYLYLRDDVHEDAKLRRFLPHEELDRRAWRRRDWFPPGESIFKQQAADAARIVAAGGRVGLGAHGQLQGLGTLWELWLLASGGMRREDVLRAATIWGAEAIGLDQDIGSIEVGKLADLQVLDKDPLARIEDAASIRFVMKGGTLYDANTLDEIWPRQRPLGRQWWWETKEGQP